MNNEQKYSVQINTTNSKWHSYWAKNHANLGFESEKIKLLNSQNPDAVIVCVQDIKIKAKFDLECIFFNDESTQINDSDEYQPNMCSGYSNSENNLQNNND
jgi:hypothetical protein